MRFFSFPYCSKEFAKFADIGYYLLDLKKLWDGIEMKPTHERIYVCHTYYHVYITILKEFALPKEQRGKATLVLSSLSTNFGKLKERIEQIGIFEAVVPFEEKRFSEFPELDKYKKNYGNIVINMLSRIIFTKKFSKLEEQFVTINYRDYKDIYVFCDLDPIGFYLSGHHIYFHAVEDGYNTMADSMGMVRDNPNFFKLKAFLSDKLNLIYVQNGFNKYCLDMEVNDISAIGIKCKKFVEVPRKNLEALITPENRKLLLKAFVDDVDRLEKTLDILSNSERSILLLTEHLCDLKTREKIFRDLISQFESEGTIFIKPHPRDDLDYLTVFHDVNSFDALIPMEILGLLPEFHFNKAVSVFTPLEHINFADEKVKMGSNFMDKYEDHSLHDQFSF